MKNSLIIENIPTYDKDERMPIKNLYDSFFTLNKILWKIEILHNQKVSYDNRIINLPIIAFKTRKKGKSLWIISGVHGEEPAGVIAIAENIEFLNKLAEKIPIVLIPLANPIGYYKDWRYINLKRAKKNILPISVGDAEHFLLNKNNKLRRKNPTSKESERLTDFVIKNFKSYPPELVLDFHEDESRGKLYIYSQGILKSSDPIAENIVSILKKSGFRFYKNNKTRFNQNIINGIVSNINDSSIDELLSSEKIIINGKIKKGPSAKSVIVIETTTIGVSLKKRVKAHSKILGNSGKYFKMAKKLSQPSHFP